MKINRPRQALSKAYLKSPVSRPEIEQFKAAFVNLQDKIDADQNEEHLKNDIRDFLLDAITINKHIITCYPAILKISYLKLQGPLI